MCLKAFDKVGHCSNLYHGRHSSNVLTLLIMSLHLVTPARIMALLLFTWSRKCLSCTSSSLKSLFWRWAFNLVKNSFCLLMSVAKIKEPSCCSISCLHPQEWKRKHTQRENPFEEGIDSVINRWLAISFLPLTLFIPQSSSASQSKSEFLTRHRFCPQTKNCREW